MLRNEDQTGAKESCHTYRISFWYFWILAGDALPLSSPIRVDGGVREAAPVATKAAGMSEWSPTRTTGSSPSSIMESQIWEASAAWLGTGCQVSVLHLRSECESTGGIRTEHQSLEIYVAESLKTRFESPCHFSKIIFKGMIVLAVPQTC